MIGTESPPVRVNGDRLELILERIEDQRHVTVRDLAKATGVSEATIRRDLKQLSDRQLIELVYGGATSARKSDQSLQARGQRNTQAKQIIGDLAGALVKDHDMLFVDAGTTCFEMRHALKQKRGLTLLVNSTRLAIELGSLQDANLILMAGQYRPDRMDTVGPLADQTVEQLRGYSCFLGADGLSQDFGVSANEMQTAYLYQHLIKNAKETILLADHSKFGVPSLFRIGGFEAVSKVVTDRDPGRDWQEFFNDLGIALVTPNSNQEPSPQG